IAIVHFLKRHAELEHVLRRAFRIGIIALRIDENRCGFWITALTVKRFSKPETGFRRIGISRIALYMLTKTGFGCLVVARHQILIGCLIERIGIIVGWKGCDSIACSRSARRSTGGHAWL